MMNTKTNYCDVFYQPGESPVFCYRSGLAVYEETLIKGVLVSSGYNAAGYPLNVLTNCATRLNPAMFAEPSAFHVEIDGQSLDYGLKFVDFTVERKVQNPDAARTGEIQTESIPTESILTLDSQIKPVRLKIHTLLDGTQMFTRYIEIENRSEEMLNVSRLSLMSGGIETMERAALTGEKDVRKLYSVGYFDNDAWGREGEFAWHDLAPNTLTIDTRFGRERYRHPLIFIRNNVLGTMYVSQIGWSGGCRFSVDYNAHPEKNTTSLSFNAEITSYNPMLVLRPGETFVSPEVHMGVIAGGLDEAVNEMHTHVRRSVLNMPEADASACLVGAGMGAEHDMSVETSKAFMRQFAEMGAEVFIIDAGWACPPNDLDWVGYNGVNEPDPDRYPNGMKEMSDYCHSLGMKFALWVEIERIAEKAKVYQEHPEWRACNMFGDQSKGYLDLTIPEAAQWAEEELARIITENKMDLLRVDYNVSSKDYFNLRDTGSGRKECLSLRHFNAVYKMYRNLKRRFPDVIFENCAGGGGRTDLGMMKSFHHTWVSDWQNAPHSVMITNGMTMALPPERVDRLFAGMGCHAFGSFDTHMRNTMLTHMTLNVVAPAATQANPVQMEFVKHSVDIYKNFIRKFLPTSKVYHHTPEAVKALDHGYSALEIGSADGTQGAIAAFTLTGARADSFVLIPKGIDTARTYRVTLDNSRSTFTVSGYELMTNGIRISIPASLSSELILLEAEQ